MKKILSLILLGIVISFYSCGEKKSNKKPETITIKEAPAMKTEAPKTVKGDPVLIAKGQQLFKDKTCFTCHQADTKIIGPSIKEINKIYSQKNGDIVAFLKGKSPAIVDTDPGQVAVMKANLDSFVKDLKDEELNAIKVYMQSVN
ncbi:c-type cytochrome [Thalassobellus citreus]|uniref:c-type cytochrome n=1 Tax=Thalassobellus citreus TaxID=3367752 RepID=UPI003788D6AC